MRHRLVIFVFVLPSMFPQVAGELIVKPRSTEALVGETTYFNCSTSLKDRSIFWFHGSKYVFTTVGILDPYRERFEIDANELSGTYNLLIHSVNPEDGGQYICVDDDGLGTRHSAELIVLGDRLVCTSNMHPDGIIGSNNCNIEPDKLQLSCSTTYYGSIPPVLEWSQNGSNQSITDGVLMSASVNNVTYTLTVNSSLYSSLSNSFFSCQTTRIVGKQHSCSSEVIKVLYVFDGNITANISLGEEIDCLANSSQSCTYKWKWFSDDDLVTMSNKRMLTPTRTGFHRCEATCILRTVTCTVRVMFVDVVPTTQGREKLLALLVLLAVPIGLSIMLLLWWREKRALIDEQSSSRQNISEGRYVTAGLPMSSQNAASGQKVPFSGQPIEACHAVPLKSQNVKDEHQSVGLPSFSQNINVGQPLPSSQIVESCESREAKRAVPQISEHVQDDGPMPISFTMTPTESSKMTLFQSKIEASVHEHATYVNKISTTAAEERGRTITGIAVLDGELFAVSENSSEIEVFELHTNEFCHTRTLRLDDEPNNLKDPVDIASCKDSKRLYIVDWRNNEPTNKIYCIDRRGVLEDVWNIGNVKGPLFVTHDGNIILSSYRKNCFKIYAPNGTCIDTVHVDSTLLHAIQLASGEFAIRVLNQQRCEVAFLNRTVHLLCPNRNKERKNSFNLRVNIRGDTKHSQCLYLAARGDDVIVLDFHNRQVFLLDSTRLLEQKLVLGRREIRPPSRICWDESRNLLFVVDNKVDYEGGIWIFKLYP